jgi:hypothetical protein
MSKLQRALLRDTGSSSGSIGGDFSSSSSSKLHVILRTSTSICVACGLKRLLMQVMVMGMYADVDADADVDSLNNRAFCSIVVSFICHYITLLVV